MVRRIIWSDKAKKDRIEILNYWIKRNKSKTYSKKLNKQFKEVISLISDFPTIGKLTSEKNVRIKIFKDYLIIYELVNSDLLILSIFDSRQHPFNIKRG